MPNIGFGLSFKPRCGKLGRRMTLQEILSAHQKYKVKNALPLNLGDAYLMKTNRVFKNVRDAAVELGYKFTRERFADYDVLPLTQLPRILAKKIIPYCDNVSCLKEIEKKAPKVFGWEEVPPLKPNYVMHETAHGVARELKLIYFKKLKKKNDASLSKVQEIVLQTLVEESFSNAVECMANLYASNPLENELFFKNAYIMEKAPARKALLAAVELIGFECTFRLEMMGFLHANFLKNNIALESFDRILGVVFFYEPDGVPAFKPKEIKVLQDAFKVGLDLDPGFTIFTNSFCFRLMGIEESLFDLTSFDCLKPFEKEGPYATWLSVLSAVASA